MRTFAAFYRLVTVLMIDFLTTSTGGIMSLWRTRLVFVTLGIVAAVMVWRNSNGQEPESQKVAVKSDKARLDAARRYYEGRMEAHVQSPASYPLNIDAFYPWSVRWAYAERDLSRNKDEKIAAYEGHLHRMQKLKGMFSGRQEVGASAAFEVAAAEFAVLEAEDWLAAAKVGN